MKPDAQTVEELARRLAGIVDSALPDSASRMKTDFQDNARAALQGALAKMELVTREEYDVQAAVLQRTRSRLHDLEARLRVLETSLSPDQPANADTAGGNRADTHPGHDESNH